MGFFSSGFFSKITSESRHSTPFVMFSEVVLSCSNTDSTSYLWDVRSGTVVFSLKQNMAPKNGVARAPLPWSPARTGLVFGAQTDKAIINAYSWQKDQVHSKSLCPEKIITVAVSKQGMYCAGGTLSGKIYIWEVRIERAGCH
jgi:pre-rRNA-processing protein IPI3